MPGASKRPDRGCDLRHSDPAVLVLSCLRWNGGPYHWWKAPCVGTAIW